MKNRKFISSIFPSATGNIYLFSKDEKSFFPVHPLYYIFDETEKFAKNQDKKVYLGFAEKVRRALFMKLQNETVLTYCELQQ